MYTTIHPRIRYRIIDNFFEFQVYKRSFIFFKRKWQTVSVMPEYDLAELFAKMELGIAP